MPLVEDMLCYARTGLAKAVVTGPGRAVLFMGDILWERGLSPDKYRDATFMLTAVGTWVGKPAYLAADPLTIQEGQSHESGAKAQARNGKTTWFVLTTSLTH